MLLLLRVKDFFYIRVRKKQNANKIVVLPPVYIYIYNGSNLYLPTLPHTIAQTFNMFRILAAIAFFWSGCAAEKISYSVIIHTDFWEYAVTKNNVFMELFGALGNTSRILLQELKKDAFKAPGGTDVFEFMDENIGVLRGVRIMKNGKDSFKWRGIEVHTDAWVEVINTPDYKANGRVYDKSFFVETYRACVENTYWDSKGHSCEHCPQQACSLAGATDAEQCSSKVCYLSDLENKINELTGTVEDYHNNHTEVLRLLENKIRTTGGKMSTEVAAIKASLSQTQTKARESQEAVRTLQLNVSNDMESLKKTIAQELSSVKSDITAQETEIGKVSNTVLALQNSQSQQEVDIKDVAEALGEVATNLKTVTTDVNERLTDIEGDLKEVESLVKNNLYAFKDLENNLNGISNEFNKNIVKVNESMSTLAKDIKNIASSTKNNTILINQVQRELSNRIKVSENETTSQVNELSMLVDKNKRKIEATGKFVYSTGDIKDKGKISFKIPNRFDKGDEIELKGHFDDTPKKVSISFLSHKVDTIPLRMRFHYTGVAATSKVLMDSQFDRIWKNQREFSWPSSIEKDDDFEIIVDCQHYGFLIYLNGHKEEYIPQKPSTIISFSLENDGVWIKGELIRFKTPSKVEKLEVTS